MDWATQARPLLVRVFVWVIDQCWSGAHTDQEAALAVQSFSSKSLHWHFPTQMGSPTERGECTITRNLREARRDASHMRCISKVAVPESVSPDCGCAATGMPILPVKL